jgi:F-type H+-transporting ATPase subunit delta
MAVKSSDVRAAKRYAAALFNAIWDESGQDGIEGAAADLGVVEEMLAGVPHLRTVIVQPMVSDDRKRDVIEQAFKARLGKITFNFLNLLVQKRREGIIDEIISEFRKLADEKAGRVEAFVEAASALSTDQVADLQAALERRTGKTIRMHTSVDESMIGGVRVRIGDDVFDAGLKTRLEKLRATMLAAK